MTAITPPLYLFDSDQTHDLLWAERIDGNIATLLFNAFQNHAPFSGGSLPVVLVDRYIPGGDSIPWASEWTTTYFEFLKPLSRTHLLNDGEINGAAYGFTPEYQANLPSSLNLGAAWPERVKIKVTKGQTGLISWLERAHSECHAGRYCPQVSNQIQVWMRRHKVLTAFEDLEVELDCRLWLHNSVVVQNASFEGITEPQKRLFRYADLDDVLEDCYGQFNISVCKALTSLTYAYETPTIINAVLGTSDAAHQRPTGTLVAGNPVFTSVPDWYYYASLYYAFPEGLENARDNLGKKIGISFSVYNDAITVYLSINPSLQVVNEPKTYSVHPAYSSASEAVIYRAVDSDDWGGTQPEEGEYYQDYVFKKTGSTNFNYIFFNRAVEDNYIIYLPAGNQVLGGGWRSVIIGTSNGELVAQIMPNAPFSSTSGGYLESGSNFIEQAVGYFPSDFVTGQQTYLQVVDWKSHSVDLFSFRDTKLISVCTRFTPNTTNVDVIQAIDKIESIYSMVSKGFIRIDLSISAIE